VGSSRALRGTARNSVGMPAQSVGLFLAEHAREAFTGPSLSYGRQDMNVSYPGTRWMFERLGLAADPAGFIDPPPETENIDFARLINLMGVGPLTVLDVSPYQDADIIADLNYPVPAESHGRYGLIVDGGTMEHVFDVRQCMKNTAEMLRPGGRAMHITPVNNYVNHGFVQVSPTFFHDYYVANGFVDVRGVMIVHPRANAYNKRWNFFAYDHATMGGMNSMFCSDETQLAVYFTARKTAESTSDRMPIQSVFVKAHNREFAPSYTFAITHDAVNPRVQQIVEPPDAPSETVHLQDVVHFG
jgi:hypothetical protein